MDNPLGGVLCEWSLTTDHHPTIHCMYSPYVPMFVMDGGSPGIIGGTANRIEMRRTCPAAQRRCAAVCQASCRCPVAGSWTSPPHSVLPGISPLPSRSKDRERYELNKISCSSIRTLPLSPIVVRYRNWEWKIRDAHSQSAPEILISAGHRCY